MKPLGHTPEIPSAKPLAASRHPRAPGVKSSDFLVIGGGIIGVSIARALKCRFPDASVILLEKEPRCGEHASGRNSGVIHAGFYYTADSLKARFARDGNKRLTEFCTTKSIPLNRCGKLVVAQSAEELPMLDELLTRAAANGVELHNLSDCGCPEDRASRKNI